MQGGGNSKIIFLKNKLLHQGQMKMSLIFSPL